MSDEEQDLEEEVQDLRGQLEAERNRRRDLETTVSQMSELLGDFETMVGDLLQRVDRLDDTYGTLAGIADDAETSAEARKRDLLIALERKARDRGEGKWAMDYQDIKDELASFGHGRLDDKQAYRLIEQLPEQIDVVTKGTKNGNQAVRINLEDVDTRPSDAYGSIDAVSRTSGVTPLSTDGGVGGTTQRTDTN